MRDFRASRGGSRVILPSKHLTEDRALLSVGADILRFLDEPKTVSRVWVEFRKTGRTGRTSTVTYDWFVLALDLLYTLNAIDFDRGKLKKAVR
jgi:hypothetical protein